MRGAQALDKGAGLVGIARADADVVAGLGQPLRQRRAQCAGASEDRDTGQGYAPPKNPPALGCKVPGLNGRLKDSTSGDRLQEARPFVRIVDWTSLKSQIDYRLS